MAYIKEALETKITHSFDVVVAGGGIACSEYIDNKDFTYRDVQRVLRERKVPLFEKELIL